ncbi:MAG: class I SAM-dependent methyltransferase [Planctomycetes bacterium]|nr:class I SAM-dependent methyltransferase [Planctomycetota bacterium]
MHDLRSGASELVIGKARRFLDTIYEQWPRDILSVAHTMSTLLDGLQQVRREMSPQEWRVFCEEVVPKHGLAEVIRQDPFTLHSVRKPRGYAGDAELLDYIYGHRSAQTTTIGKDIFAFTTNTPACRAVRRRAEVIAGIIDSLAEERGPIRVLSIACGHLREADMSGALRQGKIREYAAFDQDPDSLAHVDRRLGGRNVRTVRGSIGELLLGRHKSLYGYDFVYAAGLYDYLTQRLATRMTSWMFDATGPGGLTLLTNFLRDNAGAGYMEAFMEWELILRSPNELIDTARQLPADQIADQSVYTDELGMVVYVELRRTAAVRTAVDLVRPPLAGRLDPFNPKPTGSWSGRGVRSQ